MTRRRRTEDLEQELHRAIIWQRVTIHIAAMWNLIHIQSPKSFLCYTRTEALNWKNGYDTIQDWPGNTFENNRQELKAEKAIKKNKKNPNNHMGTFLKCLFQKEKNMLM